MWFIGMQILLSMFWSWRTWCRWLWNKSELNCVIMSFSKNVIFSTLVLFSCTTWMFLSPHPDHWVLHGSCLGAKSQRPYIPQEPSHTHADSPYLHGPWGYDSNLKYCRDTGLKLSLLEDIQWCSRRVGCTSMYGKVFNWNRRSNISNMTELFFTDAGGRATHRFGLSIQCEKLYTHTTM